MSRAFATTSRPTRKVGQRPDILPVARQIPRKAGPNSQAGRFPSAGSEAPAIRGQICWHF